MNNSINVTVPPPAKVSRREFLYYLWGASAAALTVGGCAATTRLMNTYPELPKSVPIALEDIPAVGSGPIGIPKLKAWLVHLQEGLIVLSGICTFIPVPYPVKWVGTNCRFECPHCGGKYALNGQRIEPFVASDLNRYQVRVKNLSGWIETSMLGEPVRADNISELLINPARTIYGRVGSIDWSIRYCVE